MLIGFVASPQPWAVAALKVATSPAPGGKPVQFPGASQFGLLIDPPVQVASKARTEPWLSRARIVPARTARRRREELWTARGEDFKRDRLPGSGCLAIQIIHWSKTS